MADSRFSSMMAMMGSSSQPATAPVPTQTFAAQNIIGTPIPQVGTASGAPNYGGVVGQAVNSNHIVLIVIAVIVGGYLAYHFTFEK